MATKSTVFKASLQIADIDHGYYADHTLTLARHPSETDERMMVRLAALALQAYKLQTLCNGDAVLGFGAGLSDPDDKALTKACGKADEVVAYCFGHAAEIWWRGIESKLTRPQNLHVYRVPTDSAQQLGALAQRSMQLQATIQENVLMLGDGKVNVDVEPVTWK